MHLNIIIRYKEQMFTSIQDSQFTFKHIQTHQQCSILFKIMKTLISIATLGIEIYNIYFSVK